MNRSWITILTILIALATSHNAWGAISEDLYGENFTLDIFGNANMDDTIDEKDIAYVEGVIKGTNAATNLSDANYDGKIDIQDEDQIDKIIHRENKELTIVDSSKRIVSVKKPVEKITVSDFYAAEVVRAIGAKDKIVGVGNYAAQYPEYYPDLYLKPTVSGPNYEQIIKLDPDIVINLASFGKVSPNEMQKNLESADIPVVGMDFYIPPTHIKEVKTLGYLLDKEKEADDYITFLKSNYDLIKDRLKDLKQEEKKSVYYESGKKYFSSGGSTSGYHELISMAGGINIFADFPPFSEVDPEAVIKRNPDVIVKNTAINGYNLTNAISLENSRKEVLNRLELANITAVKNDDVYALSYTIIGEGGKYPAGVCYLAKILYPDKFNLTSPAFRHTYE